MSFYLTAYVLYIGRNFIPRRGRIMTDKARQLVKNAGGVYALPEIHSQLSAKLQDPTASNPQLADIVQLDAGLSSNLLKIANSAFYGFPSAISTIAQAITIIGRTELAELILSQSVMQVFDKLTIPERTLQQHWHHSLLTGLIARQLCKSLSEKEHSAETMFVAGLLHDIGKLVTWHELPEASAKILAEPDDHQTDGIVNEQRHLGFDHEEVGAELLKSWKLPAILAETTLYHHQAVSEGEYHQACKIIYLANQISHVQHDSEALEKLSLTLIQLPGLEIDSLEQTLVIANEQYHEMSSLFGLK